MGETKTPHFYAFETFEPITKSQNQLFLSLEKTRIPKKTRKPQYFFEKYDGCKSRHFETP